MKFFKVSALLLVSLFCQRAHSQQLPVVNYNGQKMYAPDLPFLNVNLQNCTGPGCGGVSTGNTFRGGFNAGTSYNVGDVVNSGLFSYVSTAATNIGNTPSSASPFWSLLKPVIASRLIGVGTDGILYLPNNPGHGYMNGQLGNNNGVLTWQGSPVGSGGSGPCTTQTLTSPAATVNFATVPAGYNNLVLRFTTGGTSGVSQDAYIQFNGDTAADYNRQYLEAVGSTVNAGATSGAAQPGIMSINGTGSIGFTATSGTVTIFNYAALSSVIHQNILVETVKPLDSAQAGVILTNFAGRWDIGGSGPNPAITSVLIGMTSGQFNTGGVFSLCGVQ